MLATSSWVCVYQQKTVAVVIPAYNIANEIGAVIEGIPEFVDSIIVVDDASTDRTVAVLHEIVDHRLSVLQHAVNRGVGGAMVTGFRRALECGAELVVKMDGDGQMDPQFLPALLDPIVRDGYGYAKGNRFLCSDRLSEMPVTRLIGSFVLTFLSKLASGYWHIFDSVNGYVAIEVDVLRKLPLDRIQPRYFFENDMLIHLNVFRVRVKDVAIPPRYGDERSSMRIGRVLVTFPVFLLKGFSYRLYHRHVLREFSVVPVFWIFGLLLFGWGAAFGGYEWIKSMVRHQVATTGTVMLCVLPLILGFQLLLQALIVEIQDSPR